MVCTGSGGAGKTTISAAIALEAAVRGKKAIVLTIDPARRLANALGLKTLSSHPVRVPAAQFHKAGLKPAPLQAMMLDTKTTFDRLIQKIAKDTARAERIIENRFYQAITGALSGTHEYMAMEELYELHSTGRYDIIVIDTPPTANALDFLEAPQRMTSFLKGRLLKWFLLPVVGGGKGLFRLANVAAVQFLRILKRIIGSEVLEDTAEFFANFEGMYEGFKERATEVNLLLRQEMTSFVVVTSPAEQSVMEAMAFASTLNDYDLHFAALIVNRIHPACSPPQLSAIGSPVVIAAAEIARRLGTIRRSEESALKRLGTEIDARKWARVPHLTHEVVDLNILREVAGHVFV